MTLTSSIYIHHHDLFICTLLQAQLFLRFDRPATLNSKHDNNNSNNNLAMGRHISKVVTAIIVISLYLIFRNDHARFGGFVSTTTTRFHRGSPSAQALRATRPVLDLLNEKAQIEPPVDSEHNLAAQNEGVSYGLLASSSILRSFTNTPLTRPMDPPHAHPLAPHH